MNAAEVIALMQLRLDDIDADIERYVGYVEARVAAAGQARAVLQQLRMDSTSGTKTFSGAEAEARYEALLLDIDDPEVTKIVDDILVELRGEQGRTATINKDESSDYIQQLETHLQGLNSESEVTSIRLQSLVQMRSRVVEFASNTLSSLSKALDTITGNVR